MRFKLGPYITIDLSEVLPLLFNPLFGALFGVAGGWITGLIVGDTILQVFAAAGIKGVAVWKLGCVLGFINGYLYRSPKSDVNQQTN